MEQQQINIRPTLIVGAGDFGESVILQAKSCLRSRLNDLSLFRFFAINFGDSIQSETHLLFQDHLMESEKVELSLEGIQDYATSNLGIRDRISDSGIISSVEESDKPRIRGQSWLAFDRVSEIVRRRLVRVIEKLLAVEDRKAISITETSRVNVYLIASLGEVIGSGILVELARLISSLTISDTLTLRIRGVLLLPDVTNALESANAYATLKELGYYNSPSQEKPQDKKSRYTSSALLEGCYLVSTSNESGKEYSIGSEQEVVPFVAEWLYQVAASPLSESIKQQLSPHPRSTTHKNVFSGVGLAIYRIPVAEIVEYLSLGLSLDMIDLMLSASAITDDSALKFWERNYLNPNQIIEELISETISLESSPVFGPDFGTGSDKSEVSQSEHSGTLSSGRRAIMHRRQKVLERSMAALFEELKAQSQRVPGTFEHLRRFLDQCLNLSLGNQSQITVRLNGRKKSEKTSMPDNVRKNDLLSGPVQQASQRGCLSLLLPQRISQPRQAAPESIQPIHTVNESAIPNVALEEAYAFYNSFATSIRDYQEVLNQVTKHLTQRRAQLAIKADSSVLNPRFSSEIFLTEKDELDALYAIGKDSLQAKMQSFLNRIDSSSWFNLNSDGLNHLVDAIYRFSRDQFDERVRLIDIMERFTHRFQTDNIIVKELNGFLKKGMPSWNHVGRSESPFFTFLGLQDGRSSRIYNLISDLEPDVSAIDTNDRHSIVLLTFRHNVPITQIVSLFEYKWQYERVERKELLLHTTKEAMKGSELLARDTEWEAYSERRKSDVSAYTLLFQIEGIKEDARHYLNQSNPELAVDRCKTGLDENEQLAGAFGDIVVENHSYFAKILFHLLPKEKAFQIVAPFARKESDTLRRAVARILKDYWDANPKSILDDILFFLEEGCSDDLFKLISARDPFNRVSRVCSLYDQLIRLDHTGDIQKIRSILGLATSTFEEMIEYKYRGASESLALYSLFAELCDPDLRKPFIIQADPDMISISKYLPICMILRRIHTSIYDEGLLTTIQEARLSIRELSPEFRPEQNVLDVILDALFQQKALLLSEDERPRLELEFVPQKLFVDDAATIRIPVIVKNTGEGDSLNPAIRIEESDDIEPHLYDFSNLRWKIPHDEDELIFLDFKLKRVSEIAVIHFLLHDDILGNLASIPRTMQLEKTSSAFLRIEPNPYAIDDSPSVIDKTTTTTELVSKPVASLAFEVFDDGAMCLINRMAHGSPYLVLLICYELVRYRNEKRIARPLTGTDVVESVERLIQVDNLEGEIGTLSYFLYQLTVEEKLGVFAVCDALSQTRNRRVTLSEVKRSLTTNYDPTSNFIRVISALMEHGLLTEKHSYFYFDLEILTVWFQRKREQATNFLLAERFEIA